MTPERRADLIQHWHICYDFNLKPGDVVLVAGCYEGDVMELLLDLYPGIVIHGFDPQTWATKRAYDKLTEQNFEQGNQYTQHNWYVHHYGLADKDCVIPMYDWYTDACTVDVTPENVSKPTEYGVFKEFNTAIHDCDIDHIDLFVCNMEGYEYVLFNHINHEWLASYSQHQIRKLCVQWHGDEQKMNGYIFQLTQHYGYKLVYDTRPAWTYMELPDKAYGDPC